MVLDSGYWERLKDFYESDYTGILPNKNTKDNALEMIDGAATIYENGDDMFNPDVIDNWMYDTRTYLDKDDVLEYFPNFFEYDDVDEIASWFMHRDMDSFRDKIKNGDKDYINEALRLKWEEMIEIIPGAEIFLF